MTNAAHSQLLFSKNIFIGKACGVLPHAAPYLSNIPNR